MANVLVLDDSKNRLQMFRRKFTGHYVKTVETVRECIDLLKSDDWDYLFLDHDLGGQEMVSSGPGTGYEVAEWLAEHKDRIPEEVILHTFNSPGAQNMKSKLPNAKIIPGAWL